MDGNKTKLKFLVLGIVFLLNGLAVYTAPNSAASFAPQKPLTLYIERIEGYKNLRNAEMTKDALAMLNMDDYAYANYENPKGLVNLFIGYYKSADQAYDAHSPLICYPSQGWKIVASPRHDVMYVGPHSLNYEEVVTSLNGRRELVLYWYQARQHTTTQAYKNKVFIGYNKLLFGDESHSFIRVAIPFGADSYQEVKDRAKDFISIFYPQYLQYLNVL